MFASHTSVCVGHAFAMQKHDKGKVNSDVQIYSFGF